MSEKRVKCSWCNERMAPLKLSNMLVDDSYEVQVVCSYCIVSRGAQQRFREEGVQEWPERMRDKVEDTVQTGVDVAAIALYALPWLLFLFAIWGLVFKGVSI